MTNTKETPMRFLLAPDMKFMVEFKVERWTNGNDSTVGVGQTIHKGVSTYFRADLRVFLNSDEVACDQGKKGSIAHDDRYCSDQVFNPRIDCYRTDPITATQSSRMLHRLWEICGC